MGDGRNKCGEAFMFEGFLYEARESRKLVFQVRDFIFPLIALLQLEIKNLLSSLILFLHKEKIQF